MGEKADEGMSVLAILFLIGVALRGILWWFDSGFGGIVWDIIMWVSSLTWVIGAVMAIHILTGLTIKVVL